MSEQESEKEFEEWTKSGAEISLYNAYLAAYPRQWTYIKKLEKELEHLRALLSIIKSRR
jgi:hypothetical protein